MSNTDTLLRLLGIEHPIIQAPMAGVATPALAAAVSNAGALGSMGLGSSNLQQAREMIVAAKQLTERPFNVNVFCHRPGVSDPARENAWLQHLAPYFDAFDAKPPKALSPIYQSFNENRDMLDMLLEERPAVVSFHFGLPASEWIQALKDAGIVLLGCATTVDEARQIEQAGLDAIIAQGAEAGGHRGTFIPELGDSQLGTFALLQLLSRHCDLPLIAAGGIMDGGGMAAAMRLGAAAVQMGTAFILCPESSATDAYRSVLKSEKSLHTQLSPVISGRPARAIVNRMHEEVAVDGAPVLPDYPMVYDASKALNAVAAAKGDHGFAAHWAGQAAALAREMPAAELIATLVEEWRAAS